MNRRTFLRWIAGTAAGVALAPALDLDRLLWEPEKKTIFIPAPPKVAVFQVGDIITIEGQYAINPMTGQYTAHSQQFVVTADVYGGATVTVQPYQPPVSQRRVRPVLMGKTVGTAVWRHA